MFETALILALTWPPVAVRSPPEPAARVTQAETAWRRTDSRRFEIHYLPALAGQLERVTGAAERAYDRVSTRLNFVLGTKVPLIMFAPSGELTREQVVTYATSDRVAPQHPHRSRIMVPMRDGDTQLDALLVHELTHLLFAEIILPQAPGDGGVPRWVHEGIASHVAGGWTDDNERLMRDLVAAGKVPALSQLTGASADPRLDGTLGHAVFDYIVSRWGDAGIRRFIDALIVPRVDRTYDRVLDLTPAEFDAAFREYAARRFRSPRLEQGAR
jgi:hypothetical protein